MSVTKKKTAAVVTGYKALLAKAKENWDQTVEAAKKGGGNVYEDGDYIGKFAAFEIKPTKDTADLPDEDKVWGALLSWAIQEGDHVNEVYPQWLFLLDNNGEFNPRLVRQVGLMTDQDPSDLDIEQFEEILQNCLDEEPVFLFKLKTTAATGNYTEPRQWFNLGKRQEGYEAAETETPKKSKAGVKPSSTSSAKKPATKTPEPEPEDDDETEAPCEVGDEITFEEDGEELTGIVSAVDEEEETVSIKVKVGKKTKTFTKTFAELAEDEDDETEDEDEGTEFEVGQEVSWSVTTGIGKKAKTEDKTGTIHSIDEATETAKIRVGGTAKKPILDEVEVSKLSAIVEDEEDEDAEDDDEEETEDGDEEDEEDEEEEEEELEVGNTIVFTDPKNAKKTLKGKVTKINEATSKVTVKVGAVIHVVGFGEIVNIIPEDDNED